MRQACADARGLFMRLRLLQLSLAAALLPFTLPTMSHATQQIPTASAKAQTGDRATAEQIEKLVRDFLANVPKNDKKVFEEFFADDVIYTRASGVTVTKADIIKNIDVRAAHEPDATYDSDDFTVHSYKDFAVVNFRLVQHLGAEMNYFRNTGTFLKRNGKWQVVAWQATKVPAAVK